MKRAALHTTRRNLLKGMLAARMAPVLVPARLLAAGSQQIMKTMRAPQA